MKRFLLVLPLAAYMLLNFNIGSAFASKSVAIPEPASMLFLGCGLIAFVMVTRRKKRK